MKKRNRHFVDVEIATGEVVTINIGDEVLLIDDNHKLLFPKWLSGKWVTVVGISPRDTLIVTSSLDGDWTRRVNPVIGVIDVNIVSDVDDKLDVREGYEDYLDGEF